MRISKPFYLGVHEVTQAEFQGLMGTNPSSFTRAGLLKDAPADFDFARLPVDNVTWYAAVEFCRRLSDLPAEAKAGRVYRLPSEAEWEYAARAGTTSTFWWGKEVGKSNANCDNCGDTSLHRTMRTGSYRPNGFGLYDTSGNVYEWVEDCWNDNYKQAPKDGSAWTSGQCRQRVIRGGSFANKSNTVTSAARFRYDLDVRYFANGFRVVRDVQ